VVDFLRSVAGVLSKSWLLKSGKEMWERNQKEWDLPLTRFQKIVTGIYIILDDYHSGLFPPKFSDKSAAYENEINYDVSLPGLSQADVRQSSLRKPFWFPTGPGKYFPSFMHVVESFCRCGIVPPQRILELGCGCGWMSEFLALMGFDVLGTTIAQGDVDEAKKRIGSIKVKGLPCSLDFTTAPMESVCETLGERGAFDAVFVFEALHHVFDWRSSIQSAYECLKPGGYLLVFREPNMVHTFVSYRVARLSNTHEIGFRPSELTSQMKIAGFRQVDYLKNRYHFFVAPVSLAARK